jgi:hypothetical protein
MWVIRVVDAWDSVDVKGWTRDLDDYLDLPVRDQKRSRGRKKVPLSDMYDLSGAPFTTGPSAVMA